MSRGIRRALLACALASAAGAGDAAAQKARDAPAPSDSAAVAAVIDRFHAALAAGDSAAAAGLLTPDAVVLEAGGLENRAEYLGHHLGADIEFARSVRVERRPARLVVSGDLAWAASMGSAAGEFRGRAIDSTSAELMVLARTDAGWRIAAIHWSARPRPG